MKEYIRKFRKSSGVMQMNAIDFYKENGKIIEHSWENGGESKKEVDKVPDEIEGYKVIR